MCNEKLTITQGVLQNPVNTESSRVITFEELRSLVLSGKIFKHLFRYKEVEFITYRMNYMSYPLLTSVLLRLLSRKMAYIRDEEGNSYAVSIIFILTKLRILVKDYIGKESLLKAVSHEVDNLIQESCLNNVKLFSLDTSKSPLYLRTDLWFGVYSGGSVGHITGVLNNFDAYTGKPIFYSTDFIPMVRGDIVTHIINPGNSFWDFKELLGLHVNNIIEFKVQSEIYGNDISFIYQRYSTNNYAGVKIAKAFGVPFVLEYNGSQIWISRNWGKPLKYESLSERIELLNLYEADIVVVVSKPMMEELVNRGIDKNKILVNPNGVDVDRYSPYISGISIRERYKLNDSVVIGFIGTFGKWHGAEKLAEAFGRFTRIYPGYKDQVKLMMIGDGMTMFEVKEIITKYNINDNCILTGLVHQEEGPAHLAACDILVSPHVPNPDGTPFFGSPTKLFEYMAMGKGIIASDLDQIGEILSHNRTAWMVRPGDIESLMDGIKKLVDDKELRDRLGNAARKRVVECYTWKEHTKRIIESLKSVTGKHKL